MSASMRKGPVNWSEGEVAVRLRYALYQLSYIPEEMAGLEPATSALQELSMPYLHHPPVM